MTVFCTSFTASHLKYSQIVSLRAITLTSIECRDLTVIFPFYPKIDRDFPNILP